MSDFEKSKENLSRSVNGLIWRCLGLIVAFALLIPYWIYARPVLHEKFQSWSKSQTASAQVNANVEIFPIVVDGKKIGEMIDKDFGWHPIVTKDVIQVGHTTGLRGYVFSVNSDNPANDVGSWRLAVTQDVAGKVGMGLYPQVAFVEEGGQMVHVFERRIILDRAMEQKIYYVATGPVGGSEAYAMYKKDLEATKKK